MKIKHTIIVGMGALGLLYGQQIQEALGYDAVSFLMDRARLERHKEDMYTINGRPVRFRCLTPDTCEAAELVIFAVKGTGLQEAMDMAAPAVGPDTVILSVLNGISSEALLAERFGEEKVLGCVAIGMDAMRDGTSLQYCNKGKLQIGVLKKGQGAKLEAVSDFLESIGQTYEIKSDIMQAMWSKFLLNVGVNQTCMVYETTYEGLQSGEPQKHMLAAMREVIAIAEAEGVDIGEEDLKRDVEIVAGLKPDGYPSMRQDAVAHRPSEVALFAGTVMEIAAKYGIPVPVNTWYYERIREMERKYG